MAADLTALLILLADSSITTKDADVTEGVRLDNWKPHLSRLPQWPQLRIDADGNIGRDALWELSELTASEDNDQHLMDLFWNVIIWGSGNSMRHISKITESFERPDPKVMSALRVAHRESRAGKPRHAFDAVIGQIPGWGRAFFTKYLAFSADRQDRTKLQAVTLDSRVRIVWRCLTGTNISDEFSASVYEYFCQGVHDAVLASGLDADTVEQKIFAFGQVLGPYDQWLIAQITWFQRRSEERPTTAALLDIIRESQQ